MGLERHREVWRERGTRSDADGRSGIGGFHCFMNMCGYVNNPSCCSLDLQYDTRYTGKLTGPSALNDNTAHRAVLAPLYPWCTSTYSHSTRALGFSGMPVPGSVFVGIRSSAHECCCAHLVKCCSAAVCTHDINGCSKRPTLTDTAVGS